MENRKILYLGNFNIINHQNAAGKRVLFNALALKSKGFDVILLSSDAFEKDGFLAFERKYGLKLFSFYKETNKKQIRSSFYSKMLKLILSKFPGIECIIMYGSPTIFTFSAKTISLCKKRNISCVSDVVDWLPSNHGNLIFRLLKNLDTRMKMKSFKKCDGIIAITSFLANYYCNNNTIVIPPLSDKSSRASFNDDGPIKLYYAGEPFKVGEKVKRLKYLKDRIDIMIKSLHLSKEKGIEFEFHIIGLTKNDLKYSLPSLKNDIDYLDDKLIFHGKQNRDFVENLIHGMDCLFLIREINKGTTAGFPTKVSEAVNNNIPVLTTRTSDIAKYVKNGRGCFYVELDNIAEQVYEILKDGKKCFSEGKKYLLDNYSFDYHNYQNCLNDFIIGLSKIK